MDASRKAYWSRKLRPIRVGAEPVADQLRRRFQAILLITGLTMMIAMMMLAIFVAFGQPGIGLRVAGVILLPGASWFWLDHAVLRSRVLAYQREQRNEAPPE